MFSPEDRDRAHARVIELAEADARIVAAAVVGSLSRGTADRWADLDFAFGIANGDDSHAVLADLTSTLSAEWDAIHLFDLPAGSALFRVLLLPGCLQCDLSVMPASEFGAIGPKFTLLFGHAVTKPFAQPPPANDLLGYAVHHAVRTRFCIERGRYWQAEYWIGGVRDHALALACRARNLPARDGRGFDDLPVEVTNAVRGALVGSLDRTQLLRALDVAIAALLQESGEASALAAAVAPRLLALTSEWRE